MDRFTKFDDLRNLWIDQYVRINDNRPELRRFKDTVGRVVTVNYNGKALVDFQDGAWYDIPATDEYLIKLDSSEAAKYKNENSAQVIPEKQG